MRKDYRIIMLYLAFVILLLLLMCSCKTQYVTVPEYHTEYVTRTDSFVRRDSVYVKDSVTAEFRNDTLYINRCVTKYVDRWRDRVVRDTVFRTDSVAVPYPVEKRLGWWQQRKQDLGELMALIIAAALAYAVYRIVRKR